MARRKLTLEGLAGIVADAFANVENSGGLVESICSGVQNLYRGKEVPTADADFIIDEVSRQRGWTNNSARVRKSETKAILNAYAKLPEAIERARKKKHVSFDAAVKLARSLNKGMTPNQAAIAYAKGGKFDQKPAAEVPEDEALKRVQKSIKGLLKLTKLPRKFRSELRSLCEEYDLAV